MRKLRVKMEIEKLITCYENDKLPLHQECPFGQTEITTNCNVCIRRQQKIISTKTLEQKKEDTQNGLQ